MSDSTIELAKEFIAIRSTPDNTEALTEILQRAAEQLNDFSVKWFEREGVQSIFVSNTDEQVERYKIILNGHLDIIPGKEAQFTPSVQGDRLYGVGSMDMKANAAALIEAFRKTASHVSYPLGIQLVTDEEVGGFNGTKYQVDEGVRSDFVVVGESTDFDIEHQAKGVLWLKISAQGESAHGAYPWAGKNALWKLHEALSKIHTQFPTPQEETWSSTVNLSHIETPNATFNKIPDTAEAWLDVRFVPKEQDTIIEDITSLLPAECSYSVVAHEPAFATEENNTYLQRLKGAIEDQRGGAVQVRKAHGSSDVRHFARVGCAGVEFGPIGAGMGTDEEWVDIPSVHGYQQILTDFLMTLDQ